MKKSFLLIAIAAFHLSCNDDVINDKEIDKAGKKLQKTVKKATDSAGAKLERLKDKIEKSHSDTSHL